MRDGNPIEKEKALNVALLLAYLFGMETIETG